MKRKETRKKKRKERSRKNWVYNLREQTRQEKKNTYIDLKRRGGGGQRKEEIALR